MLPGNHSAWLNNSANNFKNESDLDREISEKLTLARQELKFAYAKKQADVLQQWSHLDTELVHLKKSVNHDKIGAIQTLDRFIKQLGRELQLNG